MPENSGQPTHHYVLTLQVPNGRGLDVVTFSAAVTPPQGWTRQQFYKSLYVELTSKYDYLKDANTLFWTLESNQL
ncbi:hypothetical protein [Streptomyces sp. NPDC058291]|uniref:hypothetical protein n=1 Tax=Streptomyces sp. NPDC058291 TaxID=3346427 RepID=UPI0036E1D95B